MKESFKSWRTETIDKWIETSNEWILKLELLIGRNPDPIPQIEIPTIEIIPPTPTIPAQKGLDDLKELLELQVPCPTSEIGENEVVTSAAEKASIIENYLAKWREKHSEETINRWDNEWIDENVISVPLKTLVKSRSEGSLMEPSVFTPVKKSSEIMNLKWGEYIEWAGPVTRWEGGEANYIWKDEWLTWWDQICRTKFLNEHRLLEIASDGLNEYIQLDMMKLGIMEDLYGYTLL